MAEKKTWGITPTRPTARLGNARQAIADRNGAPTDATTTNAAQAVPPVQHQPHGTEPAPAVLPAVSNLAVTADPQPAGDGAASTYFQSHEMRSALQQPFNIDEFLSDSPATPVQAEAASGGSGHNAFQNLADKAGLKLPKMPKVSMPKVSISKPTFKLNFGGLSNHSPSRPAQEPERPSTVDSPRVDTGWTSPRPLDPNALRRPAPAHTRFQTPRANRPAEEESAESIIAKLQAADITQSIPQDSERTSHDSETGTPTGMLDPRAPQQPQPIAHVTDEELDALIEALKKDLSPEPEKKQQ